MEKQRPNKSVVGATGAGKSIALNYLLKIKKAKMREKKMQNLPGLPQDKYFRIVDDENNAGHATERQFKTGHYGKSITQMPEVAYF